MPYERAQLTDEKSLDDALELARRRRAEEAEAERRRVEAEATRVAEAARELAAQQRAAEEALRPIVADFVARARASGIKGGQVGYFVERTRTWWGGEKDRRKWCGGWVIREPYDSWGGSYEEGYGPRTVDGLVVTGDGRIFNKLKDGRLTPVTGPPDGIVHVLAKFLVDHSP